MNTDIYKYPAPLGNMQLLRLPGGNPEDVILDQQGRIYCGLGNGGIVRMTTDGSDAREILNTKGRPLGLDWLPDGRLLICDSDLGLLAADLDSGAIELLLDHVNGQKMRVTNNPSVARDGTIYFSDSSTRYPLSHIRHDIVEHVPTGRLLRRNPDGSVDTLLDRLQFANGVVLAPNETFVLVAETGANRINRVWLKGQKAGQHEIFADQLPGMPDNMSLGSDGLFWLALPSPADKRLKAVHSLPRFLRSLVARIPDALQPPELRCLKIMAFDAEGKCIHHFEGDPLRYHLATGVRESNGWIVVSSIEENALARFPVPARLQNKREKRT